MVEWPRLWSKNLFKMYCIFSIIFIVGIVYFWIMGPIEIAQICGLALFWTVFGAFINSVH
jgi:hypothetical protein